MNRKLKTEHNGAKNGGGFWGPRKEAKELSKKARRENDKQFIDTHKYPTKNLTKTK